MKRIVLIALLISCIATPCFAVNIFDSILYKKAVLCANHMTVLVNRVTGEVTFILLHTGKWERLQGTWKNQCQSMYEAQIRLKLNCR